MVDELQMFCLGVNYRSCPVAVREQFAVGKKRLAEVNAAIAALPGIAECVLLSTCNRTELYYWSENDALALPSILGYFLGNAPDAATRRQLFYRLSS